MSDYIKEKIKEFRKKFELKYDSGSYIQATMQAIEPIEKWIVSSLQEMEERTREEERKIRLYDPNELKRQGAKILEDQRAIWKKAYELGYREGVHEGYNQKMNDSLSHKKESGEKECICRCHWGYKDYPEKLRESIGECSHCSPKKEKRGR